MHRTRPGAFGSGLRCLPGCLLGCLLLGVSLTGCAGGSGAASSSVTASVTGSGAQPTPSSASAGPPGALSVEPSATAGSPTSATASASASGSTPAATRSPFPNGPMPDGMQPPSLVAASGVSCVPLSGGGHRATFSVTLAGGSRWTLLPEDGPVTASGAGSWRVVVDVAGPVASISLKHVKVGGGSPFTTSVLAVPAGLGASTSC